MIEEEINKVRSSYGRCVNNPAFFEAFYDIFVNSHPEIKPMFKNTDMDKQKGLLKQGISYMFLFAKKSSVGVSAIKRLATMHDKDHLAVKPDLYAFWVNSLISTVEKHDKEFTSETKTLWENVLTPGIKEFKAMYHAK